MQQLLPQFARKYRNMSEMDDDMVVGPVKETILNVPKPPRMENKPIVKPNIDLNTPRPVPQGTVHEGKSVNSILENAIKREIQLYDKENATASAKKTREIEIRPPEANGENMDTDKNRATVSKESISNVNMEIINSESETVVVSDQETVKISTVAHEVNYELKHQTECKDQIQVKCESPIQKRDCHNISPTKCEQDENADSQDCIKIRPPCGRIVQKTSPAPKVKLAKDQEASSGNADASATDSKQRQPVVTKVETNSESPAGPSGTTLYQRPPPIRKTQPSSSAAPSAMIPSQRPPPMRNVWSTIRIENGEISPMPMPAPLVQPLRKGTCSPKKSVDSPKAGRSTDSPRPRGHPSDPLKGRSVESSMGRSCESPKCSEDNPKGRPEPVKKGASPKRSAMKKMTLMKKTVMMGNKLQQGSLAARAKNEGEDSQVPVSQYNGSLLPDYRKKHRCHLFYLLLFPNYRVSQLFWNSQ
jgi:hypothetical protein